MAQPAVEQNSMIRKARLENERARKRNEQARKRRANLEATMEGGQNVDPQRLQTVSGQGGQQQTLPQSPSGMADRSLARGQQSDQQRQVRLRQQQQMQKVQEEMKEEFAEIQSKVQQEVATKTRGRIMDFITGTLGPIMGGTDAATGGASLIITGFVWTALIIWWDIKAYLGPKLKGSPLGFIITPLTWGSLISAFNISGSASEALEDKGKPYLYGALGLINLAFFLVVAFIVSILLAVAYAVVTFLDDPMEFILGGGQQLGSIIHEFF